MNIIEQGATHNGYEGPNGKKKAKSVRIVKDGDKVSEAVGWTEQQRGQMASPVALRDPPDGNISGAAM